MCMYCNSKITKTNELSMFLHKYEIGKEFLQYKGLPLVLQKMEFDFVVLQKLGTCTVCVIHEK